MTDAAHSAAHESTSEPGETAVRAQLDRILKSAPFQRSRRRQRFLEYIVNETLAGRADRIKGYTIALEVFERPATFDSNVDPTVRMEAGRLRDRLREYYAADGQADPVRIELPKGSYTPTIEVRQPAVAGGGQVETIAPSCHRVTLAKIGLLPAGMLTVTVLVILAAGWLWMTQTTSRPSQPGRPSIAVLPFDNIGGDPRWKRFADGITEDIITDLAQTKDLVVIARNSTGVFKDKLVDIRQVGRELDVKYVLEGSIQATGDQIRVTAQLIEAASGSHVWSERYDRPADDLFAVQNSVTQGITSTLAGYEGAVAEAERNLIRRKPPANLTAYDTYLLAMEAKHKVTKEGLAEAEDLFRKALQLDPRLARAYCGLATVQFYMIDLGLTPSVDQALSTMLAAAEKAVQLDPHDGQTHLALGMAYAYHGKPELALAEFNRAEKLAPSNADLLLIIAWSLPQFGESDRAVALADQALKLNPHYPDWYNQGLSLAYLFGAQYDRSVKYRLLVKEPLALDYAFLAIAYAHLGRASDAARAAASVARLDPAWIAEKYLADAGSYGDKEAEVFVSGARKAGLPGCIPSEKIRDLPNLVRVKSCDEQRAHIAG